MVKKHQIARKRSVSPLTCLRVVYYSLLFLSHVHRVGSFASHPSQLRGRPSRLLEESPFRERRCVVFISVVCFYFTAIIRAVF